MFMIRTSQVTECPEHNTTAYHYPPVLTTDQKKHVAVSISPARGNQKWAKATILLETSLENAAGMILASVTFTKPQGAREADVQRFCFCGPNNSCTQPGLWDLCWPLRSRRQRRMPRPIADVRMWENFFLFFFLRWKVTLWVWGVHLVRDSKKCVTVMHHLEEVWWFKIWPESHCSWNKRAE